LNSSDLLTIVSIIKRASLVDFLDWKPYCVKCCGAYC